MISNVSQCGVTQSEQAMPDGYAGLEQTISGFGAGSYPEPNLLFAGGVVAEQYADVLNQVKSGATVGLGGSSLLIVVRSWSVGVGGVGDEQDSDSPMTLLCLVKGFGGRDRLL
jgi:hypothetical protein